MGPGENPLSEKKSERKAALATVKKRIDQAAEIGATMLCGPMVQPLGHFTGVARTDDEWKRCVEYLGKVGEYAAENRLIALVPCSVTVTQLGTLLAQVLNAYASNWRVPVPNRAGAALATPQLLATPLRVRRGVCRPVAVVTPGEPGGADVSSVVVML